MHELRYSFQKAVDGSIYVVFVKVARYGAWFEALSECVLCNIEGEAARAVADIAPYALVASLCRFRTERTIGLQESRIASVVAVCYDVA